jgi:hypothetical protein
MELSAYWEQFSIVCYQIWVWLKYEGSTHPFLVAGAVVVFLLAWAMYKTEVRSR